jgi:hypothetical protein
MNLEQLLEIYLWIELILIGVFSLAGILYFLKKSRILTYRNRISELENQSIEFSLFETNNIKQRLSDLENAPGNKIYLKKLRDKNIKAWDAVR